MNTDLDSFYALNNITNYKTNLDVNITTIISKYNGLILEYLQFIYENNYIKKRSNYFYYVMRGYDIVSHVFHLILYYTQNIDMATYHGQKAFFFYLEFLDQTSGGQNVFLQLTSQDACLFVYKKTICELNNDMRQNTIVSQSCSQVLDKVRNHGSIIKSITSFFLQHLINNKNKDQYYNNRMLFFLREIMEIFNNDIIDNTYTELCNNYLRLINDNLILKKDPDSHDNNIELYNSKITNFFKILIQQNYNEYPNILNKILDPECKEKINMLSNDLLFLWLFSKD